MQKRQLRNYLIEPDFQLKIIGYFGAVFAVTTVTLYLTVVLFFWRLNSKALGVGIPPGHVFFRFVNNERFDLALAFAGLALVNLIILIGVGFVVSHRVAGPIYKLKNYLRQMSEESPEFRLRKNDFFKDLEPIINDLKTRLK
jgi:hypothetical protein